MPDSFDKFDLDKLYDEKGFYQGHLGAVELVEAKKFGTTGYVTAKDGEYKGRRLPIGKPFALQHPICEETSKGMFCREYITYNAQGRGTLSKARAIPKAEVEARAIGPEVAEVGAEVIAPVQAGIFGGGNTMLMVLGLGVIALIGGIMFFGKRKRKKAVSYAG